MTASELYATWATARGWVDAAGRDLPTWTYLGSVDQRAWEAVLERCPSEDKWQERVDALTDDVDDIRKERDGARYNARVLAHSYRYDADPPRRVVDESLAYPVRSET